MPRVETTTRIHRSPKDVHAFVRDFDRYPEWIPFTKEVTRVEGDGGPGTRYWERGTGGKSRWEVIEVEEGRREVHTGDIGIATMRIEMTMDPVGKGRSAATDFHHAIEYTMKVPVLGALIDKIALGRNMRKGMDTMSQDLKRILEAET